MIRIILTTGDTDWQRRKGKTGSKNFVIFAVYWPNHTVIWAEVSSSSFLLAFASPHLLRLFLLFFLYESFTWPRKFTPVCQRIEKHRSFSRFTGFRYSILRPFEHDVEILNLIQDFAWSAVLTLFDASLLFTLRRSYRKIMFKTDLLSPLDFRVNSEGKWRSSAIYSADIVKVNTCFLNFPTYCKRSHSISQPRSQSLLPGLGAGRTAPKPGKRPWEPGCRYPAEIPLLIF